MNHMMMQVLLSLSFFCPLAVAQSVQTASPSTSAQPAPAAQPVHAGQQAAEAPQSKAVAKRMQAIRDARTICIHSETLFLTVSTLERAIMKQKNWERLGLNIVGEGRSADLQIDVDRLHFTHIHTYVVTDKSTGIVLAAGRIRSIDGVIASGPMAEQIVNILSAGRLPTQASGGEGKDQPPI